MTLNSHDPSKQHSGRPTGDEVDRQGCFLILLGFAVGVLIPVLGAVAYFVLHGSVPYLLIWLVNRGPLVILALVVLLVVVYKLMEAVDKALGGSWATYALFRKFMEGRFAKIILLMLFGLSIGLLLVQVAASFIPKH